MRAPAPYIYWYITTALTVGYGDLSPKGDLGRLLASFFVMPGAIACFTAALAKTLDGVASVWRQKRLGRGDYSEMKNAIVLIGYDKRPHPAHDRRNLSPILSGTAEIVLYSRQQFDNVDPRYRYVHATSLTSTADMAACRHSPTPARS